MILIKDLVNNERYNDVPLLVIEANTRLTNSGSQYLNLILRDKSAQIEAKIWDVNEEVIKIIKVGEIYLFDFFASEYKGKKQLKINNFKTVIQSDYNLDDFQKDLNIDVELNLQTIFSACNDITNENLKKLTTGMLLEFKDRLKNHPAAIKLHHAFRGGLSEHIKTMLEMAKSISLIYKNINIDLLNAAIIIHDLGKIIEIEMVNNITYQYGFVGRLTGHISIASNILYKLACEYKIENTKEYYLLNHLLLAHHGKLEFGSPIKPKVLEALILHYIDDLDAKINLIQNTLNEDPNNNCFITVSSDLEMYKA